MTMYTFYLLLEIAFLLLALISVGKTLFVGDPGWDVGIWSMVFAVWVMVHRELYHGRLRNPSNSGTIGGQGTPPDPPEDP